MAALPQDIVTFWTQAGAGKWFARSAKFDEVIRLKFEPVHHRAARGEYDAWSVTAEGSLALLVLLDQFPRNLYRGSAHAFATDPKARSIARAAVEAGHDKAVDPALRQFFYLPFVHSEDMADQDFGLALYAEAGDAEGLKWAEIHHDVIARFHRFPHRNPCLGRATTPEEHVFLEEGGFRG